MARSTRSLTEHPWSVAPVGPDCNDTSGGPTLSASTWASITSAEPFFVQYQGEVLVDRSGTTIGPQQVMDGEGRAHEKRILEENASYILLPQTSPFLESSIDADCHSVGWGKSEQRGSDRTPEMDAAYIVMPATSPSRVESHWAWPETKTECNASQSTIRYSQPESLERPTEITGEHEAETLALICRPELARLSRWPWHGPWGFSRAPLLTT